MILATSRFKVLPGFEGPTIQAFQQRPRLVDASPGFLGMEVFTDHKDPHLFYLITRWTDLESFRRWHGSEAHHRSHAFLPKGLKLDASFTKVRVLERLPEPDPSRLLAHLAADSISLLAEYLAESTTVIFLSASRDGRLEQCNRQLSAVLKRPQDEMLGASLWDLLTDSDVLRLRTAVEGAEPGKRTACRLNFVAIDYQPVTFECRLECLPDKLVLIGEPNARDAHVAQEQLLQINNQATVLIRDLSRQMRAFDKAKCVVEEMLEELRTSYWHLRKLQEVLPVCMNCGKIKSSETNWEQIVHYLKQNNVLLSHSYCPACAPSALSQW